MILVEVEKEFMDSLCHNLNDNLGLDFFLNPDEKEIQFYFSESTVPVVVKPLVTRAPIYKQKNKKQLSLLQRSKK